LLFELVAESGAGDDVFIVRLRDVWHKQWNLDVHSESCIRSLCDQLEKLEHAKQSQQSPTQVVLLRNWLARRKNYEFCPAVSSLSFPSSHKV